MDQEQASTPSKPIIRGRLVPGQVNNPSGNNRFTRLRRLEEVIAEMSSRLGRSCDPAEIMMQLAAGFDEFGEAEAKRLVDLGLIRVDGSEWRELTKVPRDVRLDAAKSVCRYIRPMLQAVTVTGKDQGPVQISRTEAPISDLMSSIKARELAEEVAIALAKKALEEQKQVAFNRDADSDDLEPPWSA